MSGRKARRVATALCACLVSGCGGSSPGLSGLPGVTSVSASASGGDAGGVRPSASGGEASAAGPSAQSTPACSSLDVSAVAGLGPGWDTQAEDWNYTSDGAPPAGSAQGCSVALYVRNASGNQVTVAAVTMILRTRTDPTEMRQFMHDGFPNGPSYEDLTRAVNLPGIGDDARGVANAPLGDVQRPYVLWAHRGANTVQLAVEIYHEPGQPSGPAVTSAKAQTVLVQLASRVLETWG